MKTRVFVTFAALVLTVVGLSVASNRLWGVKQEDRPSKRYASISANTTLSQAANAYGLDPKLLKRPFGISSPDDLNRSISELGLTVQQAESKLHKASVLAAEESSKNWFKIPLKFALWLAFLITVFGLVRRGAVTASARKRLLLTAVVVFGVVLGADPSPMGTIKDAIVMWGKEHVLFPPRLVAFVVFTLSVVLANKFICSWGCQLGTLQDLIFRINRNSVDTEGIIRQWKPSFALTNTVRAAFFVAICSFALAMGTDIVHPMDPFALFRPASLGIVGAVFVGLTLAMSLFVYRPWCHFFCPFGLTGWLFERISINRVRVNRNTCTSCGACAKACPSTVMDAILKRKKTVPDCFSCATCIGVCPTRSISFGRKCPLEQK